MSHEAASYNRALQILVLDLFGIGNAEIGEQPARVFLLLGDDFKAWEWLGPSLHIFMSYAGLYPIIDPMTLVWNKRRKKA